MSALPSRLHIYACPTPAPHPHTLPTPSPLTLQAQAKLAQHEAWEAAIMKEIEAEEQQRKAASQAKDEL